MNELKKKLAEWIGLEHIYKATDGKWYYYEYQGGENKLIPDYPHSLDACFKHLVPKFIIEFGVDALDKTLCDDGINMGNLTPLGLCLAIEKLIGGEKEMITAYKEGECPEVRHKRAGDESYDMCNLVIDKPCLIEHGLYRCEYFEQYLEEEDNGRQQES